MKYSRNYQKKLMKEFDDVVGELRKELEYCLKWVEFDHDWESEDETPISDELHRLYEDLELAQEGLQDWEFSIDYFAMRDLENKIKTRFGPSLSDFVLWSDLSTSPPLHGRYLTDCEFDILKSWFDVVEPMDDNMKELI